MAIIREISDSNLETGRNGSKSGVSQIMQESWKPCVYSQTPFFGHLIITDSLLCPWGKKVLKLPLSYIFSKFDPVNMDTPQCMG